ncbi:proteasome maturation protein [Parasteatoda tepidariorum]|uniref:Proteasome maturation protein n=1 Tax=Parasteatoda tepidariorum TaxID=114398 RepID=A0A2L2Y2Q7_PARTP|nr:proteasome maturation protein [Parasteatoda tepidariorum]XP_015921412.1 proteasome maturation protein [Parasteatoda tepidariorum]
MDLPSLKPKPQVADKVEIAETSSYGTYETLTNGFTSVRSQLCGPSALEESERNYCVNAENMKMAGLRRTQGIHAPLRLIHERNAAKKIQRLPFLPSSNIALETLEGRDETIDMDDFIFNDPFEGVESLASPFMVMEKHLFGAKK